ncbi:MAG TPA: polysaccharide deacetylase family protein [Candidatus Saccharimonadales bacterium]|nr:polysaccharide deacetylase family protein [Candidatus Saccharimonadales bacterium]
MKRVRLRRPKKLHKHPFVVIPILICLLVIGWQDYLYHQHHYSVAADNLLVNGNFMQFDDGVPTGWQLSSSGSNNYAASQQPGHIRGKSLQITIGTYESGAVELRSPVVNVAPGKTYLFKGYYDTNSPFDVLLRAYYADGTSQLQHMQTYPVTNASQPWFTASTAFRAGPSLRAVQIVYSFSLSTTIVLSGNYLQEEPPAAVAAIPLPAPAPTVANLVASAPATQCAPKPPANWTPYHIGTNQPDFSYTCDSGGAIFHTQISNYHSGEAKWQHTPVAVRAARRYCIGLDYRSDAPVNLVAEYAAADGSREFATLATFNPSNEFTHINTTAEPPYNGTLFVSAILRSDGNVDTRNYTFTDCTQPGPATFKRPLVSVTFDDGWLSTYQNGADLLARRRMKATYYLNPTSIDTPDFMTTADVQKLKTQGNELASHGYQHIDMTGVDGKELDRQLSASKAYIEQLTGQTSVDFAPPYGTVDAQVLPAIRQYYASGRSTDDGINTRQNFNRYDLKVLFVGANTTPQQLQEALDDARQYNAWLIVVYHRVDKAANKAQSSVTAAQLAMQLDAIQKSRLPVVTVAQAMAELVPQL